MANSAGARRRMTPPDVLEKPLENCLFKGAQFWLSKLRLPKLLLEGLAIIIFLLFNHSIFPMITDSHALPERPCTVTPQLHAVSPSLPPPPSPGRVGDKEVAVTGRGQAHPQGQGLLTAAPSPLRAPQLLQKTSSALMCEGSLMKSRLWVRDEPWSCRLSLVGAAGAALLAPSTLRDTWNAQAGLHTDQRSWSSLLSPLPSLAEPPKPSQPSTLWAGLRSCWQSIPAPGAWLGLADPAAPNPSNGENGAQESKRQTQSSWESSGLCLRTRSRWQDPTQPNSSRALVKSPSWGS